MDLFIMGGNRKLDITPEAVPLGQWDVYGCSQHTLLIQSARKGSQM